MYCDLCKKPIEPNQDAHMCWAGGPLGTKFHAGNVMLCCKGNYTQSYNCVLKYERMFKKKADGNQPSVMMFDTCLSSTLIEQYEWIIEDYNFNNRDAQKVRDIIKEVKEW